MGEVTSCDRSQDSCVRLRLGGSATHGDATEVSQPVDANGNLVFNADGPPFRARYRRAEAPEISLEAGAEYKVSFSERLDRHIGTRFHYRSAIYNQRQELFRSDPLATIDLSAGVSTADGRYSLDVIARNLNDQQSAQFGGPSPDPRFHAVEAPSPSRTVLITLSAHF